MPSLADDYDYDPLVVPPATQDTGAMTGAGSGDYQSVAQDHSYDTDLGYCVMPVAGRTPKFRRIRLHGGVAFRRVTWKASRANRPPVVPAPKDTLYGNDLLLSYSFIPSLPAPNPNQAGYNWTIRGEYLYVQNIPREPGVDAIPTGAFPYAVAPNDSIASQLVAPIIPAVTALAGPVADFDNEVMIRVGAEVAQDNLYGSFIWPFTTLAPVFTNTNLIAGG